MSLTYATTFSGIGGWELGLNACGWNLRWQCEREPFCQALLRERFGVPICPDIHELPEWLAQQFGSIAGARVDALIGSPPCQPFSVAGAKRGTRDERHLYPAFIRAAGLLRPRYILMEQVPNVRAIQQGKVFAEYLGGLAALGYDLVWHCLPACALGAPHRRDRLWIIAHAKHDAGRPEWGLEPGQRGNEGPEQNTVPGGSGEDVAHASRELPHRAGRARDRRAESPDGDCHAADSSSAGREELHLAAIPGRAGHLAGIFAAAAGQWATEPNVGRVAHGVPARVDRLRGLGNAVLPQTPFLIGQAINEIEGVR